ncbi:J domain-containing protein [Chloroflexus sp.]|uniref:J domain-containing protein n=1 Tax=Chloroflexus sp. TaxID=1904827 RepID=UPI0026388E18|nr:J domain-containing protein [uncultured Chloroflexus sp.]
MTEMTGHNYYNLLGVSVDADQATIAAAYEQQRQRYAPERLVDLDHELQAVARERLAELERAFRILSDPERRRQYDISQGLITPPSRPARRGLSRNEALGALTFALLAVGLVVAVWVFTNRNTLSGQAMGEINRPAPNFSAQELRGGTIELAQYRGKVVLINFWGTWCEPCKRELPALQQAYEQFSDQGLMIIGVNLTDDEQMQGQTIEDVAAFLAQYGVTYPIALDLDGKITEAYRVFPLPTSFFITTDGQIRYVHIGELTLTDIAARFAELRPASGAQP